MAISSNVKKNEITYQMITSLNERFIDSWQWLADSIYLLKNYRQEIEKSNYNRKESQIQVLNVTILLNLAATVEGAITRHLENSIRKLPSYQKSHHQDDFPTVKMFTITLKRLNRGFNEKINAYKEIFDLDLKESRDYNAVNALMNLRNMLAHGGSISYEIKELIDLNELDEQGKPTKLGESSEFISNIKPILNYLKKEHFIEHSDLKKLSKEIGRDRVIFSSKVADHFIVPARNFIYYTYQKLNPSRLNQNLEYIENIGEFRPPINGPVKLVRNKGKK